MTYEKRLKSKQETADSMSTRLQIIMKAKDGNTREH